MLFGKIIAVFPDNNRKHTNELCGEDAEILMLKIPGGTYSAPLFFFLPWGNSPQWAKASLISVIHDHTQIHHTR